MKAYIPFIKKDRVIARFGGAALVRTKEGRTELRGGERCDHLAAREWISLFMHDAVPRVTPCRDAR
jgi:hypothetical protein